MKIKILYGVEGAASLVNWKGIPVGGTEGTLALTRPPIAGRNGPEPLPKYWRITHIPTGMKAPLIECTKLSTARAKAKKLFKLLKKHGVHKATDRLFLMKIKDEYLEKFG